VTASERGRRAVEIVVEYERKKGRQPTDVSKSRDHLGYDILSGTRKIEVKGVAEQWKTYTWQGLYTNEVDCLKADPSNFFLYIVKFVDKDSDSIEDIYIIQGTELMSEFHIEVAMFALAPISRTKLSSYRISDD
jgi:hypothetical protein